MIFNESQLWSNYPVVAFDTETSGAYPLESEIIELGAVKWYKGEIVGKFQTLLKPSKPLTEDNIKIHGITNEMVKGAPLLEERVLEFCEFIDGSILLAHHAPFDLGFLTPVIEKTGLNFPSNFHLCTSLLSRALLHTSNHKLQTLVKELNLTGGDAHRAFDDAYACMQVFFKCVEKITDEATLRRLKQIQVKKIEWSDFCLYKNAPTVVDQIVEAIKLDKMIQIMYEGGTNKNKFRPITPKGIVRNPDGDYVHAQCELDHQRKRFYLSKILQIK